MANLGVDISSIQGNCNFQQMKNGGYDFIIHKAYEGNKSVDHMMDTNLTAAKNAGMAVGIYHFLYILPDRPGQVRGPVESAEMHYKSVEHLGKIMCVADCEWPTADKWSTWGITEASFVTDYILTYATHYEQLSGSKMWLYTYPSFMQSLNYPAPFADQFAGLWIASYTANPVVPKPFTDWTLWQSSGSGRVPGCLTNIDLDAAKDLSCFDVVHENVDTTDASIH